MGDERGKGADMRRALFTINKSFAETSSRKDIVIVFLDSDVLPGYFGEHFVFDFATDGITGQDLMSLPAELF